MVLLWSPDGLVVDSGSPELLPARHSPGAWKQWREIENYFCGCASGVKEQEQPELSQVWGQGARRWTAQESPWAVLGPCETSLPHTVACWSVLNYSVKS